MTSVALRYGYFDQSRLKYYCPLQKYDQKSHLPNISKHGVYWSVIGKQSWGFELQSSVTTTGNDNS